MSFNGTLDVTRRVCASNYNNGTDFPFYDYLFATEGATLKTFQLNLYERKFNTINSHNLEGLNTGSTSSTVACAQNFMVLLNA
jgi:hypothetical protein